jgi:hypothetical protein
MATIKVASVPTKQIQARHLLAMLCFYYPQYTLAEARQLKAKDVMLLLKIAQIEKSKEYFNLTQIAAAPHTKKGEGVKTLSDNYKKASIDG